VEHGDNSALRYLEASRIESPAGDLGALILRDEHDQAIGNLEGVLVDPVERRLRFYVVGSRGRLRARRYLLPVECAAQMDCEARSLRVDLDAADLADCEEFESSSVPRYSDDDLLVSIFSHRRPA
jgi:hypothetical protein